MDLGKVATRGKEGCQEREKNDEGDGWKAGKQGLRE